jgi:hypothetical protein
MPYKGKVVDGKQPEIHLDPELAAELDAAMDEADRGEWIDGEELLRKLRAEMEKPLPEGTRSRSLPVKSRLGLTFRPRTRRSSTIGLPR